MGSNSALDIDSIGGGLHCSPIFPPIGIAKKAQQYEDEWEEASLEKKILNFFTPSSCVGEIYLLLEKKVANFRGRFLPLSPELIVAFLRGRTGKRISNLPISDVVYFTP